MDLTNIVYVIIFLVVLYYLFSWFAATSVSLSKIQKGHVPVVISKDKTNTTKTNFSYSIWFNVGSWSGGNDFGRDKIIFAKAQGDEPALTDGKTWNPDANGDMILSMSLGKHENNITIKVAYKDTTTAYKFHNCTIYNVPLQKWVNIIISFDTRVLDVYMNGKLVKTCIIEKPPEIGTSGNYKVYLTPAGGFTGETDNFRFFKNSLNPQEAWNVYKAGFGSGLLSGLVNKYKLKVAFLKDDTEFNSFVI